MVLDLSCVRSYDLFNIAVHANDVHVREGRGVVHDLFGLYLGVGSRLAVGVLEGVVVVVVLVPEGDG